MRNRDRSIIYRLNESNSNNPANLLVGFDVKFYEYDKNGSIMKYFRGVIEEINNRSVVVRDNHTQKCYDFIYNGFNAHMNAIEFVNEDNDLKFYVYD